MLPRFRFYNIKLRTIYTVINVDLYNEQVDCVKNNQYADVITWDIKDGVLMQSTGLYDKNGTEIFEGDIFKAPFDIGPAGFSMCKGVVEYDLEQGYQWQYLLLSELEIMGNIYENPELLEKENNKWM